MLSVGVAAVTAIFVTDPTRYMQSVTNGLTVWVTAVVPALFPFFVFSKLLTDLGFFKKFNRLAAPLTKKLFAAPPAAGYIFVVSIISGYPVGAKMIQEYYDKGALTSRQCRKIATFTSTSGPLFILGTVGGKFLGDATLGIILFVCHIMSAIICGVMFRGFYKDDAETGNIQTHESSDILGNSVYSAISGIMTVGAFICLFYILTDMLFALPLSWAANGLFDGNPALPAFLRGVMEITGGCQQLSAIGLSKKTVAVLCGTLISFGGLCVMAQSFVFLKKCGVTLRQMLAVKCLQAAVAALLTFVAVSVIY